MRTVDLNLEFIENVEDILTISSLGWGNIHPLEVCSAILTVAGIPYRLATDPVKNNDHENDGN